MTKLTQNKILVPVDFSEQSLIALGQSYHTAREYNAELLLLHVMEDVGWMQVSTTQLKEKKTSMQKKLDKLAEETSKTNKIAVDTMLAKGKVYEKIIEVAEMVNATMIIMGCNSKKRVGKLFIGSNALRVVRESICPVITVKGKQHREVFRNIVLPLDLTTETRAKVKKAIEIANLGSFKPVIHVVSVLESADEFFVNKLTAHMNQAKNFIEEQETECTAEIILKKKGDLPIAEYIIEYANKVKGDLIIIMTQQETDFTGMFIGSTAQEIVNNSDIPVLSIIPTMHKYRMEA